MIQRGAAFSCRTFVGFYVSERLIDVRCYWLLCQFSKNLVNYTKLTSFLLAGNFFFFFFNTWVIIFWMWRFVIFWRWKRKKILMFCLINALTMQVVTTVMNGKFILVVAGRGVLGLVLWAVDCQWKLDGFLKRCLRQPLTWKIVWFGGFKID